MHKSLQSGWNRSTHDPFVYTFSPSLFPHAAVSELRCAMLAVNILFPPVGPYQ
jgi:hypothetical protein